MKLKINQNGKAKDIHLEYPGSYWAVMHQTSDNSKTDKEKSTRPSVSLLSVLKTLILSSK